MASVSTFDLPKDSNGNPLQILAPGTTQNGTAGATHSQIALPSGSVGNTVVRVFCAVDSYVKFGTASTEAGTSDMVHPSGVEYYRVPTGATHLAVERVGATDGTVSVTKMT